MADCRCSSSFSYPNLSRLSPTPNSCPPYSEIVATPASQPDKAVMVAVPRGILVLEWTYPLTAAQLRFMAASKVLGEESVKEQPQQQSGSDG